jgi:hypothetical protein
MGADEMYFDNSTVKTMTNLEPAFEPVDRAIEQQVGDCADQLRDLKRQLQNVHDDMEAIRLHDPKESRTYIQLGGRSVYPDATVMEDIKAMYFNKLLAMKAGLHAQYHAIRGVTTAKLTGKSTTIKAKQHD